MIYAGALLLQARRRARLSQRELARRAGTAASTVAKIESGRMSPTVGLLDHLVRASGAELVATLAPHRRPPVSAPGAGTAPSR